MAKIKYLVIDTLSIEDTNAMAEKICLKVANMPIIDVKKKVLKLSGKDEVLNAHKFNVQELLSLIAFYDVHTELKIKYVDTEFTEPVEEIKVMSPSAGHAALEDQKKEIKVETKAAPSSPVKEKVIDSTKLPDLPDFDF